jgi:3-deoxy-manno-octulosonate cytidylyltransferase (CMP-KDO synthetase)
MSDPLIVIPARMAAERLPDKPLADIAGAPLIVHVWRRAVEARLGPVLVATDAAEVARVIEAAGGEAISTDPRHASGSDRVLEAVTKIDPVGRHEIVLNLQADMPNIKAAHLRAAARVLDDAAVDIGTLAARIADAARGSEASVVKVVGSEIAPNRLRALYFSRAAAPWGDGGLLEHVGVYAFRRTALARFASLPRSPLEKRERLEQLRALEAGMRIDVALIDEAPLSVDTPTDLARARACFANKLSDPIAS